MRERRRSIDLVRYRYYGNDHIGLDRRRPCLRHPDVTLTSRSQ
ncbi:hypothetical protein SAZ_32425 [Streptomyces noursei ZPM]|nr:hypothetical protein SAZ_32425 [Streptomyces noursei ZPM]EPY92503.1 hypothetical protein K530_52940 [Streptomyces noursei CCRC 11814]